MAFCMPIANARKVTTIDRSGENLKEFPEDIGSYRYLEELQLGQNKLKTMPESLFACTKLQMLDLRDNDFTVIHPEIEKLVNLVELNLNRNDVIDIPEQIQHCKSLMSLDIGFNLISRLPDGFSQTASLTHLILSDNRITSLPTDIGELVYLRSLAIRANELSDLPPSITKLTRLEVLDVGQNTISELPSEIGRMVSLRELYIDVNNLEKLPDQITRCVRLEQLDIRQNGLTGLPDDIGLLSQLTDLTASGNLIQTVPLSIDRLNKLTNLRLERNNIRELPESIGNCGRLTEMLLWENQLEYLPSSIGKLQCLQQLVVDQNDLKKIPETIGDCLSLSLLSLRQNQISEVPNEIGRCEELTVLDVAGNNLTYLPPSIESMFEKKLKALWLSEEMAISKPNLQSIPHPLTRLTVLTCYLLPQKDAPAMPSEADAKGVNSVEKKKIQLSRGGCAITIEDKFQVEDTRFLPVGDDYLPPSPPSHLILPVDLISLTANDSPIPAIRLDELPTEIISKFASMLELSDLNSLMTSRRTAHFKLQRFFNQLPKKKVSIYISRDKHSNKRLIFKVMLPSRYDLSYWVATLKEKSKKQWNLKFLQNEETVDSFYSKTSDQHGLKRTFSIGVLEGLTQHLCYILNMKVPIEKLYLGLGAPLQRNDIILITRLLKEHRAKVDNLDICYDKFHQCYVDLLTVCRPKKVEISGNGRLMDGFYKLPVVQKLTGLIDRTKQESSDIIDLLSFSASHLTINRFSHIDFPSILPYLKEWTENKREITFFKVKVRRDETADEVAQLLAAIDGNRVEITAQRREDTEFSLNIRRIFYGVTLKIYRKSEFVHMKMI